MFEILFCVSVLAENQQDIWDKRVSHYLNNITAIMGNFTQTNPDDQKIDGYFWLKRPKGKTGHMRIDYINGQRIYGDAKHVVIYDLVNKTKSDPIDAEDTPAALLFSKRVDLKQFLPVCKLKDKQLKVLLRTPNAEVTLFFSLKENQAIHSLLGWHILDGQGNVTVVKFDQSSLKINAEDFVEDRTLLPR